MSATPVVAMLGMLAAVVGAGPVGRQFAADAQSLLTANGDGLALAAIELLVVLL